MLFLHVHRCRAFMQKIIALVFCFIFFQNYAFSQYGTSCIIAEPFCTGTTYSFPMVTNTAAESGPNYGCLYSQPNPNWYYLNILNPGDFLIHLESPTGNDIDFAIWGPFLSPTTPCTAQLTAGCTSCPNNTSLPWPNSTYPAGNLVDCSYDPAYFENVHISNAVSGTYYIMVVTNASNSPGTIQMSQISGTGTTNCGCPYCFLANYVKTPCDTNTNTFNIIGNIIPQMPFTQGYIYISLNNSLIDSILINNSNSYPFTINNIPSTGQSYNLNFRHSDLINNPFCDNSYYITAPVPCVENFCYAGMDKNVCGLGTNLNASLPPGYTNAYWTFPTGVSSYNINYPNAIISANDYGTYSLVWHVTSPSGISVSDTVEITFNQIPTANFIQTNNIVCSGDTAEFLYNGTSGPNAQLNWTFNGGIVVSNVNSQNPIVYWDTYGYKTIRLSIIENGCYSYLYKTIYNPNPVEITISENNLSCTSGNTVSQQSIGTTNAISPVSYSFSQQNVPPFITGNYQVTVTDNNGCTDTASFSINDSTTIVNADLYHINCFGENTGSIRLYVTSPYQPVTYLWSTGAASDLVSNITAGTYQTTITYSNGCSSTYSYTITQKPQINYSCTINKPSCSGNTNGSIIGTASGGTPPYSYLWSNGSTSASLTGIAAGNYDITITDSFFCSVSFSYTVVPNTIYIGATITKECDSTCNGTIYPSFSNVVLPVNYYWSNGDFNSIADSLCAGIYSITVIDAASCTKTQDFTVLSTNNTMSPIINSISDSSCYYPCNAQVSININGGTSPYKLFWDGVTATNYSTNNITKNNLCPGNYTIPIKDKNNCLSELSFSIDTFPSPEAFLLSPSIQYLCQNSSAILNASSINGDTCFWSNNISNNIPFTVNSSGNLNYIFTVENSMGCSDTVIAKIVSYPNQIITNPDINVCLGTSITLYAYGNDLISFVWDQGVQSGIPFIPTFSTNYVVNSTSSMGCQDTDTVHVTVFPLPNVFAGVDDSVCEGSFYTLQATGGIQYVWNHGVVQGIPFQLTENEIFSVIVSDQHSCLNTDSVTLSIIPLPFLDAGIDQTICKFDTVVLQATSNYPVFWNNGVQQGVPFSVTNTTTYIVSTDSSNNCNTTDTLLITVIDPPYIFSGNDTLVCSQQTITLHAISDGSGITWNLGVVQDVPFIINQPGYFTATATNSNGCSNSDSIFIDIFSFFVPQISFYNDTLFADPSFYLYTWYDELNNVVGGNQSYFIPSISQEYYAVAHYLNCTSDSSSHVSVIVTSQTNNNHYNDLIIYPNPASNQIVVTQNGNYNLVNIYSYTGKIINSLILTEKKQIIYIYDLSAGVYFFEFSGIDENRVVKIHVFKN